MTSKPKMSFVAAAFALTLVTAAMSWGADFSFQPPEQGRWNRQWLQTNPPARFGASMAYNQFYNTAAMYGGCATTEPKRLVAVSHTEPTQHTHEQYIGWCSNHIQDAWTWKGNGWTQIADGPTGRFAASLSYDYVAKALVLFGGARWTVTPEVNPTPPAGSERCMHAVTSMKILEGQYTNQYLNFFCFKDTWYLKKVLGVWTWEPKSPLQSPPARFDAFGAPGGNGKAMIGLGCSELGPLRFDNPKDDPDVYYFDCFHRNDNPDAMGYHRDAWEWNDTMNTWTRIAMNALADTDCTNENMSDPTCRRGVTGTYNAGRNSVFVHGGFFVQNTRTTNEDPPWFTYGENNFPNDSMWQVMNDDWILTCQTDDLMCSTNPGSLPLPGPRKRAFAGSATGFWNGSWRPFVFGGEDGNAVKWNDLWLWQDEPIYGGFDVTKGEWVNLCPSACGTKPSGRTSMAMTYFPGTGGHVLVFGGVDASGTILGDTWTFGAASPPGSVPCSACVAL